MFSRVLLAGCVVVGLLAPAHAQRRFPGRDIKPELEPFAADGTIEAIGRGQIQILTNTEQRWMIFVDPKAVMSVTGTAKADFIRRGLFVQFKAEVDKRGKVKNKIDKLTIFMPSKDLGLGVWPEGAAPAVVEGPGDNGGGFGAGDNAGNPPPTSFYTIHGRIAGGQKGKHTVDYGRGTVQIELAENPEIQVDVAGCPANSTWFTVARKGDKISITKGKMFPGRMGIAQAGEFAVTLSEPLTFEKKKRPVRPKRTIRKRSPDQPDKETPEEAPKEEPVEMEPAVPEAAGR